MRRLRAWTPALVWMGVIFAMSAMPGDVSGEQSGRLAQLVLGLISFFFGGEASARIPPDVLHLILRKGAHMAEYAVLLLAYRHALKAEGAKHPQLLALILCAAYAATDEIHQGFVAGRGPSPVDVGIDTLGAGIMWGITELCVRMKKRKR